MNAKGFLHLSSIFLLIGVVGAFGQAQAKPAKPLATSEGHITTPDNVRLFYKIVGSGKETLVVVHGGPGNSLESIRPDMEPLSAGRRVIYYDQRGQGRSEVITDAAKLGYENSVADLEAVRAYFKLDKMTLLGNSWGGLLISLYAVAHPDRIERMILDVPAPPIRGFNDDLEDEISRRMAKLYTPSLIDRVKKLRRPADWVTAKDLLATCREVYSSILRTYTHSQTLDLSFRGDLCAGPIETVRLQRTVNAYMWQSLGDFNLMPKLAAVKAPVLVIHGASDVIPLRASEFWASGYPNGRLLLINNAGHLAHVETPEVFFKAVETFLKGTFPAEATRPKLPPGP